MIRLIWPGMMFALIAVSCVAAHAEEVFFAREFLYTRTFKMGIDLFPEGSSMTVSPRGIYVAGTFNPPSALPGAGFPEPQAFIRGYDVSGNQRWTRQIAETT